MNRKTTDADNAAKAILDTLQGTFITNDNAIQHVPAFRLKARETGGVLPNRPATRVSARRGRCPPVRTDEGCQSPYGSSDGRRVNRTRLCDTRETGWSSLLRAHPGTRTRNSAADIPEPGPVPRTSALLGHVGLVVLACGAGPDTLGHCTRLQPLSATRGRAGYSWAVQSPALCLTTAAATPVTRGAWCTGRTGVRAGTRSAGSPHGVGAR
ncbi:RusA family crossover junction endodeoxyribonuclease [Streptomyces hydrogenans]|uniref:RusA family crossover junction endodeoxyribonuclease n=1 Tax=Streptomyces hydrogenans TaxID=1873719 RepID=UPI00364F48AE